MLMINIKMIYLNIDVFFSFNTQLKMCFLFKK